ncbi:Acetyl-CoA acetyltransferase-like protein [Desulfatibacillum aliphaticivorans]|uniref:Acetyl-CoA acetyltransferase-like protein n=1 Tax=Desulfatibacillum aliphaticivorans TaxID=218208 RepID=B8F9C0_DESAL|nr:thiolase family protein [Desulfatibacillum aliphaticivorans]ACL02866.1 Acetyl-CoA acetyltransferase-like protein [Desulfatibacillum aliphaticivorans]
MDSIRGKAAIVGIGEVPTGFYPDRSFIEAAVTVGVQAIKDAGIPKEEIDTVIPIGAVSNSLDNSNLVCSWLVEEMGLGKTAKSNFQVMSGGSSSANSLKTATALVTSGLSKAVLVVHSDRMSSGIDFEAAITAFSKVSINQEYESPYGFSQLALAGLLQQRYMHDTGTTERQIASVVESLRKWAALNPNAMMRTPRTADEVLDSKMICSPVRKRMMNVLADGAAAFVVTTAERARDLTDTPAYVLGMGGRCTNFTCTAQPQNLFESWGPAVHEAYEMAGIQAKDVKVAEIYDAFPTFILISMELLGLCSRGAAGSFVEQGCTSPGGSLPVSTNGAMMAQGHTGAGGGIAILVEAARQVMGKAGERQVKNADIVVETASGGVGMDFHAGVLGREV